MTEKPCSPEFLARLTGGEVEVLGGDIRGAFAEQDYRDEAVELEPLSDRALLALYAEVLDILRARNTIRSSNNPVADYAEGLCAKALQLAGKSTTGYDGTDPRRPQD